MLASPRSPKNVRGLWLIKGTMPVSTAMQFMERNCGHISYLGLWETWASLLHCEEMWTSLAICSQLYSLGQMTQLTILSAHADKGNWTRNFVPSNYGVLSIMLVYRLLHMCDGQMLGWDITWPLSAQKAVQYPDSVHVAQLRKSPCYFYRGPKFCSQTPCWAAGSWIWCLWPLQALIHICTY